VLAPIYIQRIKVATEIRDLAARANINYLLTMC